MSTADKPTTEVLSIKQGSPYSLAPTSMAEAMEFSKLIASSDLVPQAYRGKPHDVLVAVQIGAEIGVTPLQALANIAVINGRATAWGDLVVAIVQASGKLEYLKESWDETTQTATATIKRKGQPEHVETFSMADAQRAGLAGKQTYKQYPARMCGWRAKTFAIRAQFADVLKGLSVREEVEDYIEVQAEPVAPIAMPRRASEPPPDIDGFLAEANGNGGNGNGNGGNAAAPRPAPQQSGETGTWSGQLAESSEQSGTAASGRAWTLYTFKSADGERFGTFDKSLAEKAESLLGCFVVLTWEMSAKGNKNLVAIEEDGGGAS